jgi:CRP/FNR family transcriptional regulator, anaerobic regulatory protein
MKQTEYRAVLQEAFNNLVLIEEISSSPPRTFAPGTILLREGEYVKMVPLIIEGSVRVIREDESGKEILLYKIESGQSCALSISAILNQKKSRAIAITESETTAYLIPAEKVSSWMFTYKGWYQYVLRLYNHRFTELLHTIDSIAFMHMDERLLEILRKLSQEQIPADISVTHQQLANELGTAREVITRLIKKLEKDGKVESKRGMIRVLTAL